MKRKFFKDKYKDRLQLYALAAPVAVLIFVFSYVPMFGIIMAFKEYKIPRGILGSEWTGFKNFMFLFTSQDAWRITRNTLGFGFLFIIVGIACSVIFALLMYEVKKPAHVKIYQTVSIMPNFLSWVAVSYILYSFLDPTKGILNQIIVGMGGEPVSWYSVPRYWIAILLLVNLWHSVGINSIMYYAALMGIDEELFEAAELDGASKFERSIYISIPQIVPVILILSILSVGNIFRADFGLFYSVTKNMGALYPVTDVIDTYVFRALMELGNVSMASAASFVQSIVCLFTIVITNMIVKKISPENRLF